MASTLADLAAAVAVHSLAEFKMEKAYAPTGDLAATYRVRVLTNWGKAWSCRSCGRVNHFRRLEEGGGISQVSAWIAQPLTACDVTDAVLPDLSNEFLKQHRFVLADINGSELIYLCKRSICRVVLLADMDSRHWLIKYVQKNDAINFKKLKHLRTWFDAMYQQS